MKNILFVYDRMMVGGTTTALLSLLSVIDYNEYNVDLLLFKNEGSFMDMIPKKVNLLPEACSPILGNAVLLKLQKALISVFNGKHKYFGSQTKIYGHTSTVLSTGSTVICHCSHLD